MLREFSSFIRKFKLRRPHIIFLGILVLALALRVYNLPHNVNFDFDQEFAATFATDVIKFPIRMVGQSLSVQGLFDGPFYFYLMTPFFMLTHLHPLGGFLGSAIFGVAIVAAYYFVLREVFDEKTALLAAFIRAVLFTKITQDLYLNPAFSAEISVLLTWFCFYKYWKGDTRFLLPLAFIFGMYTSLHPVLFPFYLVFILVFLIKRKLPSLKIFLASVALFILPVSPLILFEYFRKLTEIKALFSVNHSGDIETRGLQTVLNYLNLYFNYPISLLGAVVPKVWQLSYLTLIWGLILLAAGKRIGFWKVNFHLVFFVLTVLAFTFYYYVLKTHSPEYHFLGVEILFFIYFVATVSLLFKKFKQLPPAIAFLLFAINFSSLHAFWNRSFHISLYDKDRIVKEISKKEKGNNNINIYNKIDFGQQYGLGYLERWYHLDPHGGSPTYIIVIPTNGKDKYALKSGQVGLIIQK